MKKQDYQAVITAKVSPAEAFKSIYSISKWWTENIEGSTQNLGDVFTVRFGDTFVTFKTIDVVPGKEIIWLVTDCHLHWLKDKKEWKATKLHFDISSVKDVTQITFTHIGLAPEIECYNDCRKGWDEYIKDSLNKLITEGQGRPERKKMEPA